MYPSSGPQNVKKHSHSIGPDCGDEGSGSGSATFALGAKPLRRKAHGLGTRAGGQCPLRAPGRLAGECAHLALEVRDLAFQERDRAAMLRRRLAGRMNRATTCSERNAGDLFA